MAKAPADCIILKDLQAFCKLGSYDFERVLGQCVFMNLEMELDLSKAGKSNDIVDSIDYVEVAVAIRELCQSKEFHLIEHLAHEIIEMLFERFSKLEGIVIEINKTIVNAEQFSGNPSIRLYRTRV
ncbi:MAG: dihydroneopterin aldolase [Candidatus Melainabacteria bacterium]|nr:dihydroneopterin aldolase [Candidatus Melainabacteria bacterium]